ncbi:hypothetical protein I7I53_11500 [Histoplasma capsulatum var. duboisii H88]|uniref:Uncharacterized protein n=1 Tax=Ajellomyces capsulatus (strain H88) TaxID=544711 RepID=A0A8A1L9G7_AJEC8|nr:hypothetical protein I7I53_11500 [Histoplasma capsulatum var. duboisii H88]
MDFLFCLRTALPCHILYFDRSQAPGFAMRVLNLEILLPFALAFHAQGGTYKIAPIPLTLEEASKQMKASFIAST